MKGSSRTSYDPLIVICWVVLLFLTATTSNVEAQRVAILTPDKRATSHAFAEVIQANLRDKIKVLDTDLSEAAYVSVEPGSPFNLTSTEAKRIGAVIGCDAFILVRAVNQRRSAFGRAEYYEAFAAVYVVSSRTGRLIWWRLVSHESTNPSLAEKLRDDETAGLSDEIIRNIRSTLKREIEEDPPLSIEEVPEENSALAKGFRPPVPYRRIKPEYTTLAALYEVSATVEAQVDLDAVGKVQRIEIVRWAGYGLDESVEAAVRSMNWRPAERNGKPLAMRFLVRYNFKKIEKDPPAQ